MSSNQPPGYGYPQGGSGDQNPYGQQPYGQQQPQGQNPYDQQPFPQQQPYAYPQQGPGYGQMPVDPALAGMPPLASTGQRFVARLIDTVILFVFLVVAGLLFYPRDWMSDPGSLSMGSQIAGGLVGWGAYFVLEGVLLSRSGQTPGKMAMKIRVARLADGSVPGSAGWTRSAIYVLPGILTGFCVGFLFWLLNVLWPLWDKPYQQALHDKAAKTVVVKV
ncbi:RDD family protein [Streptomyces sp. PA03-3a]|uniref:RDD family protein n=1 Tax=Actinacidiphila glaucinigra TaxID=235986 RepID=UPI0029B9EF7D|nr:RDD family protein [Streptomyces sp. PA03-3a]